MAKSARSAPSLVPAILALIVLVGLAYLLFADLQPSRTEHTVSPPIEIEDPQIEEVTIEPVAPSEDQQAITEKEAEQFVDHLGSRAVTLDGKQGEFVRKDGTIVIPKVEKRDTTIGQLLADKSLSPDTSVTIEYTETEKQQTTIQALDDSTEDKNTIVTIEKADGSQQQSPLIDLINDNNVDKNAQITVINKQAIQKKTTIGQLSQSELSPKQTIHAEIDRGSIELSVNDIVKSGGLDDNALFYLHRVTEADRQGLWGIIQSGLIQRFRQGLPLEGIGINKDLVRVTIPADADEPLPTGLSSFLGKILNNKVESSYIYNYTTSTMGHNPDLIYPGQQLILIHFSNDELKQIYQFFADQRNEQAETFAIH